MGNWKTVLGAVGVAIGAVVGFADHKMPVTEFITQISAALATVGLGHKLERLIGAFLKK